MTSETTAPAPAVVHELAAILREYGAALRGDWGSIDGRSERASLNQLADGLDGNTTKTMREWREVMGICLDGGGHWGHHCDDHRH